MDDVNIQIAGYKIEKELGKGGMATVYLAIQESFDREVAIKVMAKHLSSDPSFGERFLREAKIVSRLIHPNIVTVYDVGVANGHHFLSMEYIPGKDLKDKLSTIGLLHIIKIIKEIAMALDFAGRKGYVHRDIKPENIMISNDDGRAVLMDFGIARAFDSVSGMTQTGTAIGTPYYMSPEQAKGKEVDWRSDLYSLGVVFYQLLVGKVPYDGDSAISVGIKHLSDPIPKLPEFLQPDFQAILEKMMAKSPNERFQNGSELVNELNLIPPTKMTKLALTFDAQGEREKPPATVHNIETPVSQVALRASREFEAAQNTDATQVLSMPTDVHLVPKVNLADDDKRQHSEKENKSPILAIGAAVLVMVSVGLAYFFLGREEASSVEVVEKTPKIQTQVAETKQPEPAKLEAKPETQPTVPSANIATANTKKEDKNIDEQQEKISRLLAKAKLLEQQMEENIELTEELHQTYQLIGLLEKDHPEVLMGYDKIRRLYLNRIDRHLSEKQVDDAEKMLNSKLRIFPESNQDQYVQTLKQRIADEQSILTLLSSGQEKLSSDNLTGSGDDNAHYFFTQALALDPKNEAALAGLAAIKQRYYQLAKALVEQQNFDRAMTYIERGKSVEGGSNKALDILQTEINSLRQQAAQQAEHQNRINDQLTIAQKLMAQGHLVTPEDNNAVLAFRQVLSLDKTNKQALNAIDNIENSLAEEIGQLISFSDFELAKQKLEQAGKLFTDSTMLTAAANELNAAVEAEAATKKPKITNLKIRGSEFDALDVISTAKFSADRTIYIGFEYANFTSGTAVIQAELFDGAKTVKISTVPVIVSGETGEKYFKISRPVNGFAEGGYLMELILNDEKLSTTQFTIEN